jgi:anti-sigma B factor antagonist
MNAPTASRLAIREDMTIYQAQAQKEQLLAALAATEDLELDLSGVGEMDTAGLQLLLLLKREVLQQGKQLKITSHSPNVQRIFDFCNLVAVFGDPMLISAKP